MKIFTMRSNYVFEHYKKKVIQTNMEVESLILSQKHTDKFIQ